MKELSSLFTFFYKYIFIFLWFIGFGFGVRDAVFSPEAFDAGWLQYIALWLGVTIFIYFSTGGIKKVELDGRKLIVSNFLRSEHIDMSQITNVDGSSFLSPRLVWFDLKEKSSFGSRITFLPRHRITKGLGKHPVVAELKEELQL
ncbi:MAG: hypothetical protein ABR512_15135 [Desulfopila sp.]